MKFYIGVDYHKRFSYGTVMDESGEVLKQGRSWRPLATGVLCTTGWRK